MNDVLHTGISCKNCTLKSKAAAVLTTEELNFLESGCSEVSMDKGDKLLREGMPVTHVIYLIKGFIKVHKSGPAGKDQIMKIATPGAYIGIQTILGDKVYHYSATTLDRVQACFIEATTFKEIIKQNSQFGYEVLTFVCKEELNYYQRFLNQQQKQINGILADALLFFYSEIYNNTQFILPLTIGEMGSFLGTTRESVTRAMRNFKKDGILETTGKLLKINDLERLKSISKIG